MGYKDLALLPVWEGVNPLLFSQLCVYHYSDTSEGSGLGVSTQTVSQQLEQVKPPKTDDPV